MPHPPLRRLLLLLAAALLTLGLAAGSARAAGTPDISLSVDQQARVLQGTNGTVSLSVQNPAGQPYGYNLSLQAVLPAGIAYVGGSAANPPGDPQILTGQPAAGQTTLIWSNVSDLSPNSSYDLTFRVSHTTGSYPIGSTYAITAGAYLQTDPRTVPRFAANGTPVGGTFTGSGTGSDTSTIAAIIVEKTEPSPESELLRGVHDHQTTYTLTYRNNGVQPTTGIVLEDWLPAGLEFLGCGGAGADNTTNAPTNPGNSEEYPGSGPISVPAVGGCVAPTLVETINADPDGAGPLAAGVYTHVQWSGLGTLAPGATGTISYRAAIPLRSNALTFTGGTPPTTGAQTANLNNNSGPEVSDEQQLRNGAAVSGLYNSTLAVNDTTTHDVSAEDLAIQKSVNTSSLQQGELSSWTLTLRTSEYRYATAITVSDTLPDGLCPLGATNFARPPLESYDAVCDPVGGQTPSAPYTTAQEQADGTYQLTWDSSTDPALAQMGASTTHAITFPTRTRPNYQQNFTDATPILSGDANSNAVTTNGTANVICAGGPSDCSGAGAPIDHDGGLTQAVTDASSAGQSSVQPVLTKQVAQSGSNCATATYVSTVPKYLPGDRVCWQLRIDFPNSLDTRGASLIDFLPQNATFDPTLNAGAGEIRTGADTIPGASFDPVTGITPGTPGGTVDWTLPSGGFVLPTQIFERQIATIVALPAGSALGDIKGNLFKTSTTNTPGVSVPLRDQADFQLSLPVLAVQKRITVVNGTTLGTPVQTRTVRGGDVLTFRVRPINTGDAAAEQTEVWDVLPAGLTCADVSVISDSGACSGDTIRWGSSPSIGPTVPAGGSRDLTYQLTVPTTVAPQKTWTNTTGIRQFQTTTNLGGSFTYIPASNIDPSQNASANVPAATDTATITGQNLAITKTRTSPVDGANNTAATATIGETVSYTISLTVPRGETVANAVLSDPSLPDVRQLLVGGSAVAQLNGGALPGGFTLSEAGGTPTLTFPASYSSSAVADDVFTVAFDVTVANVAGNAAGGAALSNTGRVRFDNPNAAGQLTVNSSAITTAIREPLIGITKTDSTGGAPVIGGDVVTYTVVVRNGTVGLPSLAANAAVSPAHETTLVDRVPTGLTPRNAAGDPIADGESTTSGGLWNLAARTLTFPVNATIEAGSTQTFTYSAFVNDPAVGGSALTNTVDTTTTSMPGTVAGERTGTIGSASRYWAQASRTLNVALASVTKAADRATATVGDRIVYTSEVTIPANIELYDTTIVDTLPDSLDFDGYTSATCVAGCPPAPAPTVQTYTPVVNGSGTTTIAWDFGDLSSQPSARTIRLTYRAHVRATHRNGGANVVDGQSATNSITVASNRTDQDGPFNPGTIPTGFDDTSTPVTDTVGVIEPGISLDKQLAVGAGAYGDGPTIVQDGDQLRYRIVIRNTGNAPLYDVTVNDTPDAELTNVTLTTNAADNTDPWTVGNPAMTWLIPGPIAPGASVTVGYDADLVAITSLVDGQQINNTASAPTAFGVPAAQRLVDGFVYRNYAATPDAVQAVIDSPTITLTKTTGAPGNPDSAPAQVGQAFTWRVVVTNTSGTAGATSLSVRDTLPRDWAYVPGSASFTTGGAVEPTITANAAGDVLDWNTSIALAAGASTTLTFQARPLLAAATSTGTGAGNPHVNTASAAVRNTAGNPADQNGPFASGTDTAQAILAIPTLTVAKTPDGGAALAGNTVTYHVIVSNVGAVPATNVTITDTMPVGTTYTPGTATAAPAGGFSESAATASSATWTIASIAPGGSVDITVTVLSDPAAASGTVLTNSVSAVADQTPTPVTDTGTVTLTTQADVSASKSAVPNPATAGQTITYTIGATNAGPSVARSVVLTDVLPTTVTFQAASSGCVEAGGTVTCTLGDLAVGASGSATITARVNSGTTTNADNDVTVSTTTPDPNGGNDTAGVTVPVGTQFDLSVVKTADQPRVLNGATGSFTLRVENAGPSDATGVTLVDTLPAGLSYVSDDAGCSALGATVSCVLGTMGPGASTDIHLTVRGEAVGTHQNSATVTATGSGTAEVDPSNNTGTADLIVDPATDLAVVKTGPATVAAGGQAQYTLAVTNNGPDAATGVVVDDTLPAGTSFASGDPGCATTSTTVVRCTIGALAVGETATRTITLAVPVALGDASLTNSATVSGNEGDRVPSNNTDEAITTVGPAADLRIAKTAPAQIDQGGGISWTLVVTNAGPSTATNVRVSDTLPDGTTFVGTVVSQGTCTGTATVECDLGSIPSGGTAQVQITAQTADRLAGGSITNRATVTATEPDPDPANNDATSVTTVTNVPSGSANLAVTKSAAQTAAWGRALRYTITVKNNGPADSPNTVVTDALDASVRFQSANAEQGTCTESAGTVTCQLGLVPNGATVRAWVTVVPLEGGSLRNTVTTQSDRTDPVVTDNGGAADVVIQQTRTQLRLRKTLLQRTLRAGANATYTLVVTNTGSASATNVQVCDRLPAQLTLRRTSGGTLRNGQLCFTISKLRAGSSRTFYVHARVSATARGTAITNPASATADNAARATAKVRSPLQGVRGTAVSGVTG